jgi:uncharacterized peroxidase-related enzyme
MSVCWIDTIPVEEADGELREIYDEVKSPHGTVDNVYLAQSLRPHTLKAHDLLYRSVLHDEANTLPAWFLEVVSVYTSLLNGCQYAVTHHFANVRRLLNDESRSARIFEALSRSRLQDAFSGKELELLRYVQKLTRDPASVHREDIETLRSSGADDGQILEVNQVCACFNYANRLLSGLGVELGQDAIGYYPQGLKGSRRGRGDLP